MIVCMKPEKKIGAYVHRDAELRAYDGDYPEVAARVGELIKAELASVAVEHVGSTAVGGCEGKGIVDLMVLYAEGQLEST
ncbi:MAG: GrpB family protein, partial [Planctomycetota bacterium]